MKHPLFNKGDIVKHKHFDTRKQIINVYEDEGGGFSYSVGTEAMHHFIQKTNWFQSLTKLNFIKQSA